MKHQKLLAMNLHLFEGGGAAGGAGAGAGAAAPGGTAGAMGDTQAGPVNTQQAISRRYAMASRQAARPLLQARPQHRLPPPGQPTIPRAQRLRPILWKPASANLTSW